jgi:sulfatase modifying factor 1
MTLLFVFAFMSSAQAAARVRIPAGSSQMGCSVNDPDCEEDEGAPRGVKVRVAAFGIDRHEVTVADYLRCMAAGQCSRPKDFQRNEYGNLGTPGRDEYPVNCVDWSQAVAYCADAGGRLPL